MTITFTNIYKDNILDGLKKIISSEFNKMPIYNDIPFMNRGGTMFLNIEIVDDVNEESFTQGKLRKIEVTIRLYQSLQGLQEHNKNKSIQNRYAERIRSLIEQNSNYTLSGSTKWINGQVSSIDYEPDLEEGEDNYLVCELSCEFMTMQTFLIEE
tara:strand:+ start:29 stop:493 length:465 start_codon:yes stop_codon:yes gene_type:complete